MQKDDTITHLQIIHTWAAVGKKTIAGIEPECCESVERWIDDALELLKEQEQKTARWEFYGNDDDMGMTGYCSNCNAQVPEEEFYEDEPDGGWSEKDYWHYCPYCGAKMTNWQKRTAKIV